MNASRKSREGKRWLLDDDAEKVMRIVLGHQGSKVIRLEANQRDPELEDKLDRDVLRGDEDEDFP